MAKEMKTVGTGITAEQKVTYSGEDLLPAVKQFFENWNADREEGGGDYGAVTLSLIQQCRELLARVGGGPFEEHSQEWFADQILVHHDIATSAISRGDADSAARFAYKAGYLHSQAAMKGRWEPHALRGADIIRAARSGHEMIHGTKAERLERWRKINEDWEAEKAKGTPKAALVVAEKHGVSERQVYRSKVYLSEID